jgi:cytidine deaminase
MDPRINKMLELALEARKHAHAPYSKFQVGACLYTDKGLFFAGCNVENCSYPNVQCAEATAIGTMVAAGNTKILSVLVTAESPSPCYPCGSCRQRLSEFASPDCIVYVCDTEKLLHTHTLAELLPHGFSPEHLK